MKTRFFSVLELEEAAGLLRAGELVAFPTETVYGLGANALDPVAVAKVFSAKGRPADNPLIAHISSREQLISLCREIPIEATKLMDRFWPGPLTLVLPKRPEVTDLVTAGLDTVAIRFPNHSLALDLIRTAGVPLAAPSANRSGRPSSTTWQAVSEDLDGLIAGIICGNPASLGLESTVVDVTCNPPRVLRPGGVTLEQLKVICPNIRPLERYEAGTIQPQTKHNSPGLKHKHYQPNATVRIVTSDTAHCNLPEVSKSGGAKSDCLVFYLGINYPAQLSRFAEIRVCSNLDEYGAALFDFFRRADLRKAQMVLCESVCEIGIGVALMDRLMRASQ